MRKISIVDSYVNDFLGPDVVHNVNESLLDIEEAEGKIKSRRLLRKSVLKSLSKYLQRYEKKYS